MPLIDVLPDVRSLSRFDKLRLIQFLASELERDESGLVEADQSYPIWSPHDSYPAAAVLMQALETDSGRP